MSAAAFSYSQTVDFTANVTSGCAPLTVQFGDATTGTVSSWLWDLGRGAGSTSTLQNPSAIYTEPGVYTIVLTVNGSVSRTKTAFIEVFEKPVVDWLSQPQGTCAPMPVVFTDQSSTASGVVSEWLWLFGDGGSSTVKTPTYVYQNAGEYSVTLSVKNSHGCQATRIKEASVSVPGITARFTTDKEIACTFPAQINFTNTSTGEGSLTYEWNFGDNTTSTTVNPTHIYQQAGDFEVTLTVRNENQCTSTIKKTIKIANEGGIDFIPSVVRACIGSPIAITETAQKTVLSRQWNFGNNQLSSSFNPVITYSSAGTYTITLEALLEGNTCSSIVTRQVEIIPDPEPRFSHAQRCERRILFDDQSVHTTSVVWNFGDESTSTEPSPEHQYTIPGTYEITLTSYNALNCAIELKRNIVVVGDPVAVFSPFEKQNCLGPSLSGCAPFTLPLENKSSSDLPTQTLWTFSDNTQSTQTNVTKIFNTRGVYEVLLTVTNTLGCRDTTKAKIYVSDVTPVATFQTDKVSVCVDEVIKFTDTSQNSNYTCWNFGDNSTGTAKESEHAYSSPGLYTVMLISKNDGCSSSIVKTNLIEVRDPGTAFILEKNCTDPYTISLTNTSINYNSIQWDLGDGTESTAEQLTNTYPLGTYTVKLTATNTTTNCTVTEQKTIIIQDLKAAFEVDNSNVCKGEISRFVDKSEFATQWYWSFSDGSTSLLTDPVMHFALPGAYGAKLTVVDSDGCVDEVEDPTAVQVIDIVGNFSHTASGTCNELTVEFTDLSVGTPAITQWHWDFGDGKTSTDRHAVNTYDQVGTYPVKLELTNALGMCTIIREEAVQFTNPIADFAVAKNQFCGGDEILLTNQSQGGVQFVWDLGDGRTVTNHTPIIHYNEAGLYDISLTVKDPYGCEVTLIKPSFIEIKKPVAAFESFQTSAECPPLIATFLNRSSGDVVSWNWNFGDGQYSTLASSLNTYKTPGVYDVTLVVTDDAGCTNSITQQDIVSVGGPFGTMLHPTASCILETLTFSATTTNAVVHRWDFADGLVKEGSTTEEHIYENAGTYKPILLLIDDKGCQVAVDTSPQITVYDKPNIDFTVEPLSPFTGESVTLSGTYEQPATLTWKWLNFEMVQDTIDIVFEQAGEVQIMLSAIDEHGCYNEMIQSLTIQQALDFLPNVFTPNMDGKNDAFVIPAVYDGSWGIKIYNRWGNLVYKSDEYKNDWRGSTVASGVYYFELSNNFRKDRTAKGYVHVIH